MANLYPYTFVATTNLIRGLAPASGMDIYVYVSGSDTQKQLYADSAGYGSEFTQPITTDLDGMVKFYCEPGRIRIDMMLDSTTVASTEDVIVDQDNILMPIFGEIPSGETDDSNTQFSLSKYPLGSKIALYVNGYRWRRVDTYPAANQFRVEGNILTLGNAPSADAVILVDYYTMQG